MTQFQRTVNGRDLKGKRVNSGQYTVEGHQLQYLVKGRWALHEGHDDRMLTRNTLTDVLKELVKHLDAGACTLDKEVST